MFSLGFPMSLLTISIYLLQRSCPPLLLRYSVSSQPCWPPGQPQPNTNQVGEWMDFGEGGVAWGLLSWFPVARSLDWRCVVAGELERCRTMNQDSRREGGWRFCVRTAVWFGQEGLLQSPVSPLNYAVCDSEWRRLGVCIHMCAHVWQGKVCVYFFLLFLHSSQNGCHS